MSSFDKDFPGPVSDELEAREKYIRDKDIGWNYKKYAYITVQSTGKSTTVIKPEKGLILGDGAAYSKKSHIGLYSKEGGVRKFKPQLKSCKISNEGGQDYTDAFLYNVEFSFTVYTGDDLNLAESNFMRAGAEIRVDFGWRGNTSGVNASHILANVFNYDFSMNEDGSFDCNIKAMSPAGLWSGEDMGATETVPADGDEEPTNFLSKLEIACREAFGLAEDAGPDAVKDLGNNKFRVVTSTFEGLSGTYGAAELIIEPGFWNDDEQYIFYTTIGTLIRYIASKGDDEGNKYVVAADDAIGGAWPVSNMSGVGSADPKDFFLPGAQGQYGDPSVDTNSKNFSEWGTTLAAGATNDSSQIEKIAVSFPFLTKVYQSMADETKSVGGFKQSVKISEFLNQIFARLENLTGGLVGLGAIPMKGGKPLDMKDSAPPFDITVMNKKMIKPVKMNVYEFKAVGKKSICKSVSLSSEFDSDYVLMATKSNIEKGTSNGHRLTTKHGGIYPTDGDFEASKDDNKDNTALVDLRNKIGEKGASPERLSSYGDACRAFIIREAKGAALKAGRYGEIQYTLNLSVTIDGVWGIPFLAPIRFDRLPKVFSDAKVMFSVTAINHEFDGKGGWETSLETVMRIP